MSTPKSDTHVDDPGIVVQKPRSNIYTMMLILSLFAIVIACFLLYLELSAYGEFPWWKPK